VITNSKYQVRFQNKENLDDSVGARVDEKHYVTYFIITDNNGAKIAYCGLGYNFWHWMATCYETKIPWRIYLANALSEEDYKFPEIEKRIIKHRDGITWVGWEVWVKNKGQDYQFLLIPKSDKLPEFDDETNYVNELAKAVFDFTNDLFNL